MPVYIEIINSKKNHDLWTWESGFNVDRSFQAAPALARSIGGPQPKFFLDHDRLE
jgi:hypothetical protein